MIESLKSGSITFICLKNKPKGSIIPFSEIDISTQFDFLFELCIPFVKLLSNAREFMIEDLLVLRRQKILKAVISGHRPRGDRTLAEEEIYNRTQRAIDGHTEFVKDSLAGAKPKKKISDTKSKDSPASDTVEFVTVRFLRPISDAFLGLDEKTSGPFKKEDIAMIPAANERTWLRDGTVVRIVAEGDLSE